MIIQWIGHSSLKITAADQVIYIDPYYGDDYSQKADIILVSHDHYDHFSQEKINRIRKDDTMILGPDSVSRVLFGTINMSPGQEYESHNIKIKAVDAYSISIPNHKKGAGLGFIITAEEKTIYYAGDTDLIPEISEISADIALLPVGGTYTMGAEEAAKAVKIIKPKIAIPIHWGSGIVGHRDDADYFKDLSEHDTNIVILEIGGFIEL
ncbi:MAG: MBL fold metallo-hydrolase [Nanoarchaeota archaeon]|nr:MBL fold metallo-hydrolase [Nanoarchaeota archaeon]MBU1704058.1 MBL fold metallo-hydrolase [Nanoarchaeota archaeon]